MKRFHERDVRRFYDLLQHKSDLGLTQLNVVDDENLIGVGLFDNEDDFVSECSRYNTLGLLQAGVNPRSSHLLDDYAGLQNRIRTLFSDVVSKQVLSYRNPAKSPKPHKHIKTMYLYWEMARYFFLWIEKLPSRMVGQIARPDKLQNGFWEKRHCPESTWLAWSPYPVHQTLKAHGFIPACNFASIARIF